MLVRSKINCIKVFRRCWTRSFNNYKGKRTAGNYIGKDNSPNKLEEIYVKGEKFRVLVIPGHTDTSDIKSDEWEDRKQKWSMLNPHRTRKFDTKEDWTKVWPTASAFKWSVVPFPVRMGHARGEENDGIPPAKHQNTELMKIPNFLHLTPPHIKKHCATLKEFCTKWPEELDTDEKIDELLPVEIISHEYIRDAPTHRDIRARVVTLQIKLSSLDLDDHARDKILRLLKDKYDPETDIITLRGDRCPLRKQNYDYVHYLLTVVYHESWKTEKWESEITADEMTCYDWNLHSSKNNLINVLEQIEKLKQGNTVIEDEEKLTEKLLESDTVQECKLATENIHNIGEKVATLNKFKDSVKKLLIPGIS